MANQDNLQIFDLRTVRRNIARGRAEQGDYKAFLEALPDVSDKIRPPDEGGDDDGYDARADRGANGDAEPEAAPAAAPGLEASTIVPPMPENPAPAPPPPDPPVT